MSLVENKMEQERETVKGTIGRELQVWNYIPLRCALHEHDVEFIMFYMHTKQLDNFVADTYTPNVVAGAATSGAAIADGGRCTAANIRTNVYQT